MINCHSVASLRTDLIILQIDSIYQIIQSVAGYCIAYCTWGNAVQYTVSSSQCGVHLNCATVTIYVANYSYFILKNYMRWRTRGLSLCISAKTQNIYD